MFWLIFTQPGLHTKQIHGVKGDIYCLVRTPIMHKHTTDTHTHTKTKNRVVWI